MINMKISKLVSSILFEKKFSFMIVFLLSVFSMINLLILAGKINYFDTTKDYFIKSDTQNSIYYMPAITSTSEEENHQIKNNIRSYSCVKKIINNHVSRAVYSNYSINLELCNTDYINTFTPVDEGKWLNESESSTFEKDNAIPGVVAGYIFKDIKVGDTIEIIVGKKDENLITQKIKIIGKKNEPSYNIALNSSGSQVNISNLFAEGHNLIYVNETDVNNNYYIQAASQYTDNYLIITDSSATEESIDQLKSHLRNSGNYLTFQDLLHNTEDYINYRLKNMLPLPLFLCFVSSFSLISITVMWINHIIKRLKVYLICGCSVKKLVALIIVSVSAISIVSTIIMSVIIVIYPNLFNMNLLSHSLYSEMAVEYKHILVIFIYNILCTTVALLLPAIKLYREMKSGNWRRLFND